MDGKVVMLAVSVSILLFIGIWTVSLVSNSVAALPTTHVADENVTMTVNGTVIGFANKVYTFDGLWNTTSHQCLYNPAAYTLTSTGIVSSNINATGIGCPVSIGGQQYAGYYYQQAGANTSFGNISNTVWNAFSLMGVVLIVIAAAAILAYFGFGRFSD
jgi:hypothetical protein